MIRRRFDSIDFEKGGGEGRPGVNLRVNSYYRIDNMQSKLPLCCPVASYTTKYDMLNDIYV